MRTVNEINAIPGRIAWRSCLLVSMLACGGSSDLSEPVDEPVSITIYTSTEGPHIDPDGYGVSLDGGTSISVGATDTLNVSDLEPGPHTVVLDGWAENCTPSTSPSRLVEASPGEPSAVHFAVTCSALPALIARVRTVGVAWDLDGYLLELDGGEPQLITVADTIAYEALPTGEHEVSLSGLQDNCSFEGSNPRLLSVTPGSTAVAEFEVRCLVSSRILFNALVLDNTYPTGARSVLYLMSSDGTGLQPLTGGSEYDHSYAWSPSGDQIAYISRTDSVTEVLVVMSSDGSGQTPILTGGYLGELEWSPDATRIAFLAWLDDPELGPDLYVINSDGTGLTLLSRGAGLGGLAWSPDGRKIAFTADPLGEPRWGEPQQGDIYLVNPDGSALTRVTSAGGFEWGPAWSPDGGTIAFASSGERLDGPGRLYLMNSDGTNQRPLTSGSPEYHPRWSPDGSKILFTRGRGFDRHVVVVNADGTNELNLTPGSYGADATWSSDGRAIAYHDDVRIRLMNADGSGNTALPVDQFLIVGTVGVPRWEP